MLFLQLKLDLLFCVYVHWLCPMKVIGSFLVNHWFIWVNRIVHNSHCAPNGLDTIGPAPLKVSMRNTTIHCITLFNFYHITHWTSMSFDCMSHISIIITLQWIGSYLWQANVIHLLTCFTWSNMIQVIWRSPLGYICFTKLHPLASPFINIIKRNIFSPNFCLKKWLP
jgi:hypothetical protein